MYIISKNVKKIKRKCVKLIKRFLKSLKKDAKEYKKWKQRGSNPWPPASQASAHPSWAMLPGSLYVSTKAIITWYSRKSMKKCNEMKKEWKVLFRSGRSACCWDHKNVKQVVAWASKNKFVCSNHQAADHSAHTSRGSFHIMDYKGHVFGVACICRAGSLTV